MKFGATNEVGGKHLVGYKKLVGGSLQGLFPGKGDEQGGFLGHRRTPPIPPVGKTLIPNIKDNIIHFHLITFNLRYHNFSIIGIYLIKKGRRKKRKNHKGKSMKSWNKSKKKKQKEITNEEVTDRKNDCRHKVEHQYNVMVLFIMSRRLQMITHLNPVQLEYTIHTNTRVSPSKGGLGGIPQYLKNWLVPPLFCPKYPPLIKP